MRKQILKFMSFQKKNVKISLEGVKISSGGVKVSKGRVAVGLGFGQKFLPNP
jgi:hypothetical protein